jgi:CheY-like chemotaxis protein
MSQGEAFAPGDALHNVEVLYVDSDPQRRDSMRRMLSSLGVRRVQIAETGAEAITVIKGTQCNLVIAAHAMKPMDGVQFVRELRAVGNYPRALVPTLIVGEPVGPEIVTSALAAGANHFLVTPLNPTKLYERMAWAVGDNRPFIVKDGRYVIKPTKMTLPAGATKAQIAAR